MLLNVGLIRIIVLLLVFMQVAVASGGADVLYSEEPEGFKLVDYRSPVPRQLSGATTLTTEALVTMVSKEEGAPPLLIDVLPASKMPEWWPQGQVWLPEPHQSIAGAYWLPEIGFGTINEQTEILFKAFLTRKTQNRINYPIVLFCRDNCWISWNAAKRLVSYGYQQVYWYPAGMDGWLETDNPPEIVEVFDLEIK